MLALAVVALGVPLAISLRGRINAEVRTQAQAQADLVAATAGDLLDPGHRAALQSLADNAAKSLRGRILIVNGAGAVLVDSGVPPEVGVSYESRPEIETALSGRPVQVQRYSQTLHQQILATAVPIIHDGRPAGAVRATQSVAALHTATSRAELGLGLIAVIVLGLGLFAGALIARQVARPLRRLEEVARRVSRGDLEARAELEGSREQRSLAGSFNEMTERILRLLRAQRDFVADASHQLRTPLTGLRLRLEEAKAVGPGRAEPELDAAIGELDRLSHTIDELLLLSRAGERETAGSELDLAEIAASTVDRWCAGAAADGLRVDARHEGGDRVWADRADVERALDTLVENALRYSPAGTSVTVVSAPGRIEVRDRGTGFAEEERELVFERFHRGRAGRAGPPGNGLGLPIARELAREWGGEVTVANRDGGGAIATLWLPVGTEPTAGPATDFARA